VKRVLVVGDVIADVYRDCTFKKMCPDAPGVKAAVTHSIEVRPGGAANVAINLAALAPEARIHLVGAIGTDLGRIIKRMSLNRVGLEYCSPWDPLTKERVSIDGELQVRLDNMLQVPTMLAEDVEYHLKQYLAENDPDLIVLSDYGSGSVSPSSLEILLGSRERLLVDTKMVDLSIFADGNYRTRLIKLNYDEWKSVTATEGIPERFFEALVMTRGADGAELTMRQEHGRTSTTHTLRVQAHDVQAVDVCGCGDTFMAGLAASLLKNDDYYTAMQFANAAAATVVSKARTSIADLGLTLGMLGRGEEDEARRRCPDQGH
jgi:D-beta-D-heptose 7-phosphate kinase / D-beta-D-heptose 1-phosphate adenosyltransferase